MNMKRILILIIGLFGVAYGQFSPTSAKSAFKLGVSIGTRDSTAYAANDSLVVVINRQGRLMYRSTDGYWKLLANAASSDYVPYTGAVDNVNLGNYRLTARSIKTDSIYANSSAGMYLTTNSGTAVAHWGAGGSVEVDFKGFAGYDANRASSYTARSFTDKNYVDSSDALRVRYTDTAAMLAPFIQYSDTTGLYSQVVRTFGTQTIGGAKTFSSDITVNSMRVGLGGGGQTQNVALGLASLNSNTTGTFNTSIGFQSLFDNTTAVNNTAVGSQSLANLTTGSNNIGIGANAGSISNGAADLTTNANSIFLGSNTKASANGNTNEIVIGDNTTGNGSNTVTIGNSSITDNYFSGNIRGGAFIKSGGTSSQFLKADGSVDGTSYATAASISGTTNLVAKFTSSSTIGSSSIFDNGTSVGINNVTPPAGVTLNVNSGVVAAWFTSNNDAVPVSVINTGSAISTIGFKGSTTANAFNVRNGADGSDWVAYTNNQIRLRITSGGETQLSGALSGTSLSMSGAGSFGGALSGTSASFSSTLSSAAHSINGTNGYSGQLIQQGELLGGTGTNLLMQAGTGNSLGFLTNGSSSISMLINTGGDVLINTTTTDGTNKLIVNGGVKASSFTATNGNNSTVFNSASATTGWVQIAMNNTSGSALFGVEGNTAGTLATGTTAYASVLRNYTNTDLQLATNNIVRLTLASTGAATFSSSVTATGFIVSSDLRYKDIISQDGDLYQYTLKADPTKQIHYGYIAQEVEKTMPFAVSTNDNGYKAVNYTEVHAIKIRELEKRIEQLEKLLNK